MGNNGLYTQQGRRAAPTRVWASALCVVLVALLAHAEVEGVYVTSSVGDAGGEVRRTSDLTPGSDEVIAAAVNPLGVALDTTAGKVYWVDAGADKIRRADVDGSNLEDVVTGLVSPFDLALDIAGGKLYWTDLHGGKIQRANLDGALVEDLVTGLPSPGPIALDLSTGKVYWTSYDKIQRANLDGSSLEDVLDSSDGLNSPFGIAVDAAAGKLYHSDHGYIRRSNLDGSSIELLAVTNADFITLDPVGAKMYWTTFSEIRRANLDGSKQELVLTASNPSFGLAHDIAYDADARVIYWSGTNSGDVRRRALPLVETLATGLAGAGSIDLHEPSGKLYWTDWDQTTPGTGKIWCANRDGTNAQALLTGLTAPMGLEIYTNESKLYWVDREEQAIYRMNLDGTQIEQILAGSAVGSPVDIAVDAFMGQIYWTDIGGNTIRCADLDGTNAQTFRTGLDQPWSIEVRPGGPVYWTEKGSDTIQSSSGGSPEYAGAVALLEFDPLDIALDIYADKLYLTDGTNLYRCNFEGSDWETVCQFLLRPGGLALDLVETPPAVDFTTDVTSGRAPLTVSFTDLTVPGTLPIADWVWDFDNNWEMDSILQNPVHTFVDPGVYTVRLYVWTTEDIEFREHYITVGHVLPIRGEVASNLPPGFIEAGAHVILTAPAGWGYHWRRNGADIPGETNQTLEFESITPEHAGTYTVVYDDGSKAPVESGPFVLDVLPEGSLPMSALAIVVLSLLMLITGWRVAGQSAGTMAALRRSSHFSDAGPE